MHDDTIALFLRFRAGDGGALERLYNLHSSPLFGYLHAVLRSVPDAEDVLQIAWQRVVEHAPSLRSPEKFPIWLRSIAHREALAYLRRKKGHVQMSDEEAIDPGTGDEDDPQDFVIRREDAEQILSVLTGMPSHHQEILWLAVVDGLTHEEIASILQIPVGTSRSRLHNALRTLKNSFETSTRRPT